MSYIDVYYSRVNHLGSNFQEIMQNKGILQFEKILDQSPHTVNLTSDTGLRFRGIILSNKDKTHEKIMQLDVAISVGIKIGDIINWGKEKWIVFSKQKKTNETCQSFYIVLCNQLIKWVNSNGNVVQSWCHFTGSLDSKIKENIRTWMSLSTPQPNKFAQVIMPTNDVPRKTRILVQNEAWYVIDGDYSSIEGIIYLSLSEEKINAVTDDLPNEIADKDKIAVYQIAVGSTTASAQINDTIAPTFTLLKNGLISNQEVTYSSSNTNIIKQVGTTWKAISSGTCVFTITVKNDPSITKQITYTIGGSAAFAAYIQGNDIIKLDNQYTYTFSANTTLSSNVTFTVSDSSYATIISTTSSSCVVLANNSNKLGNFTLTATYDGVNYTKNIKVTTLW